MFRSGAYLHAVGKNLPVKIVAYGRERYTCDMSINKQAHFAEWPLSIFRAFRKTQHKHIGRVKVLQ